MRKYNIVFFLTAIALFLCVSDIYAVDDGEWQLWTSAAIEKEISPELSIIFEEETRFGNDMRKYIYQSEDIGLIYRVFNWLETGPNFRYVVQDDLGSWEHEARPHFNIKLKTSLFNLAFSNRSRFEYRYLTRTKDTWRYRNLSEIKFPMEWTRFKISPFIAEEIFLKSDQDDYNENRLSGGIEYKLLKNLQGKIFYLSQNLKSAGKWKDVNVLGAGLEFVF